MWNYIWPLGLVVLSNVMYQICAKSVPTDINPFASLIVTYLVGALIAAIFYFSMNKGGNLLGEFRHVNWAPIALGFVIVGLEVGSIYAYKADWPISIFQIVQASMLAVILIFVGYIMFKEAITWNKILGIIICLAGLGLVNYK